MKVKITLVKSPSGRKPDQRKTVEALGLKRLNQTVEQEMGPTIQGMVNAVSHLVKVEDV